MLIKWYVKVIETQIQGKREKSSNNILDPKEQFGWMLNDLADLENLILIWQCIKAKINLNCIAKISQRLKNWWHQGPLDPEVNLKWAKAHVKKIGGNSV